MWRALLVAVVAVVLVVPSAAQAVVIKTQWAEKTEFASGQGFVRVYVRKIEVTRGGWKAWVGLRNSTGVRLDISQTHHPGSHVGGVPFVYLSAPGLQWNTYESGGLLGGGQSITHARPAKRVIPAYPKSLAAGKSWFGVFSADLTKVPRNRLL